MQLFLTLIVTGFCLFQGAEPGQAVFNVLAVFGGIYFGYLISEGK